MTEHGIEAMLLLVTGFIAGVASGLFLTWWDHRQRRKARVRSFRRMMGMPAPFAERVADWIDDVMKGRL